MCRYLLAFSFILGLGFSQDDQAHRNAIRQRDQEIERLQRALAERDIEISRLRRLLDDIAGIIDMVGRKRSSSTEPARGDVELAPGKTAADDGQGSGGASSDVRSTTDQAPAAPDDEELAPWLRDLKSKGDETRSLAIQKLATWGEAILPRAETLLSSGNLLERRSAALLIGEIGSARGVPILAKAMKDNDVKVRLFCVSSLSAIETPSSSRALADAVGDEDPQVRATAVAVLTERHGQDFDEDRDSWRDWCAKNLQ